MNFAQIFRRVAVIAVCALAATCSCAQSQTGFTYNGIVRAVYSDDDLGTSADTTYANFVADSGANYVAITIEWFVPSVTGTSVAPSSNGASATDTQIIAAIQEYHDLGIKVVLKPQVDVVNYTTWRGELAPSSVSEWFTSYQAYITHYATLAQANGVEGLSIGTELKSLSVSSNYSYWETLIAAVRQAYTGPIMYGANATGNGDEYSTVSFWGLVDIIGVDGYFGLTDMNDPTIAQLEAAWTKSTSTVTGQNFNAVAALKALNTKYGKPVVFTEVGYESSKGTNQEPYAEIRNGYDPTEQENCYTAFFNVFAPESSWMKGVFWWDLQLPLPGTDDQSWVMMDKPAGTVVLPLWFNGVKAPSTASLVATPNPATVGQPVVFTASAAGTVGTTTGDMDVLFAGNTLETLQLSTSGSAQFGVPTYALPVGSYTLTSSYGGDSNYAASTSAGYTVTLSAAPTSTSLVITPTQATPPGTILFTATVGRTAAGAQGTPTGTVGFYYGTILLGTGTLNPQGVATFQVPDAGLPAATYSITAKYNGDSSDVSSISSPATVTIE
jgi:hypothetical protein